MHQEYSTHYVSPICRGGGYGDVDASYDLFRAKHMRVLQDWLMASLVEFQRAIKSWASGPYPTLYLANDLSDVLASGRPAIIDGPASPETDVLFEVSLTPPSTQLVEPLVLKEGCFKCGSRHGYNAPKCRFCLAHCKSKRCGVKSHRLRR